MRKQPSKSHEWFSRLAAYLPQRSNKDRSRFNNSFKLLCLTSTLLISLQLTATEADTLEFKTCTTTVGALEIDAQCADFKRHENPLDLDSRIIDLAVIKLAARSPEPEDEAFTIIQGGPGGSSIDMAIAYSRAFEEIRRKRDIVVLDQRGTGRSNMLTCDLPQDSSIQYDAEVAKKLNQDCANELSQSSDLRYYTTSIAVDDLEALRIAAGYSQLDLYGVSYGTRVVQHFLRKYPNSARTAILDGVAHVGLNLAGGEIARRWEDSFNSINARCQVEPECKEQHGDLREAFSNTVAQFTEQAITVTVPHPSTGLPKEFTFNKDSLFGAVRLMAYSTESVALMPLLLSRANAKDYSFVAAQLIRLEESFADEFAFGMHNSVACTEDAPFVTDAERAKANGTIVGTMMADVMQAACSVWPRGVLDENFHKPFSSDVPVLVLSGATDPITPPDNGDIATKMLGNANHIIVPAHGHGVIARGCIPKLASMFIEDASFQDLDTNCIERERAMPIFTSLTGPRP